MKKVIYIFLFVTINSFSQTKGKIYFRNGEVFQGEIEIYTKFTGIGKTEIRYKPEVDIRLIKGFNDIEKIVKFPTEYRKDTATFYFKKVKNKELFVEKISNNNDFNVYVGYYSSGGSSYQITGFVNVGRFDSEIKEEYYIGPKYSSQVEKLPKNRRRKKYKKIILKYTSKCKKFVEEKSNALTLERNKMRNLLKDYQKYCN